MLKEEFRRAREISGERSLMFLHMKTMNISVSNIDPTKTSSSESSCRDD